MPRRIPRYVNDHLAGAYLVLVISAAFAFAVLLWLYYHNAQETQKVAKQAITLSKAIQNQRRETIRNTCEAQNTRNDDLQNFLVSQGISRKDNPTAYLFVDKLAPLQDCDKVVAAATKPGLVPQDKSEDTQP